MTDRLALSRNFLARAGWGAADRRFLAGDASDRSYDRLALSGQTAVLMDAPPGKGDDPATFTAIARHLAGIGLSPPAILAEDYEHGFLLIEDLGDGLFARLIATDPTLETPLYTAATDVLIHLHQHAAPPHLPDLSAQDWAAAASFALDWYAFAATGKSPDPAMFVTVLADLLRRHADGPRVMILRDYHAENLLWLPHRVGVARVGLLDFQLAQMGQPGYDLVSLLQDARRDVAAETEAAMIARFCAANGTTPAEFAPSYATLGAQRALRIIGIFARLCLKGGKPGYLSLIPRVWEQLWRNLAHPALAPLAAICHDLLPEPTHDMLERISAQCGLYPHR
jgi:aminoglycoside/choline kinase family phosphotransferase